ncbi:MAG: SUMF1/EgtB/PvdO family nonheme iron enzyme, partial [Pseudomonadota bacterium]
GGRHPCIVPSRRVLRGGSWNNNPQNLRSANRNRNNPTNRNNNIGFRVASTLHHWARAAASKDRRARPECVQDDA